MLETTADFPRPRSSSTPRRCRWASTTPGRPPGRKSARACRSAGRTRAAHGAGRPRGAATAPGRGPARPVGPLGHLAIRPVGWSERSISSAWTCSSTGPPATDIPATSCPSSRRNSVPEKSNRTARRAWPHRHRRRKSLQLDVTSVTPSGIVNALTLEVFDGCCEHSSLARPSSTTEGAFQRVFMAIAGRHRDQGPSSAW